MGGDEKQMLHRNYHTHTKRCGHATGEDEDYIQFAIENGYEELGFSDHISHTNFQQNEEYIQKITALKEKYKDQIKILLGFECEYVESMLPYYQKLLEEKKWIIFFLAIIMLIFKIKGMILHLLLKRKNT